LIIVLLKQVAASIGNLSSIEVGFSGVRLYDQACSELGVVEHDT